ncbi:MAG TPA: tRNA dihydrouridine synthase DusB [Candidatus Magasanikbacteria bacterium]|nr:tRNA dihydrouridine synthase DusB [Candidatus Magasanikbacteria bacterium]
MKKWFETKKPILILAPMADYTDGPFGRICRKYSGKDFVIFKEMVSSEALVRGNEKTLKMSEFTVKERPLVIQIFGDKPGVMAKAAKLVEEKFKPDGIDINMGCPVPKIAQKMAAGVALMKNPKLASEIVKSVKKAVNLPVSVKTRLGWVSKDEILKFAVVLEKAGADLITLHGRTKAQGYSGIADRETIAKVKKILKIPVIANGDIVDVASAKKCLEITKADGIMIGRGALGKPWIFKEIAKLQNYKITRLQDVCKIVLEHAKFHEKYYSKGSLVTFRKHLAFYFKGVPNMKEFRVQLMQIKEYKELEKILKDYLKNKN